MNPPCIASSYPRIFTSKPHLLASTHRQFLWLTTITLLLCNSVELLAQSAQDFVTFHYNRQRNGWKNNEIALTPGTVSSNDFGEAWNSPQFATATVGGVVHQPHVYATPLYVDSVTLTGGTYSGQTFSVVFACTSNGDVYAINAFASNSVSAGTILWQKHVADPQSNGNDGSIPRGVLGTPIIDNSTTPGTMYVVTDASSSVWQAHALNITNGSELTGWPVIISNTSISPVVQNGPAKFISSSSESQRGALNLSADNTQLYVPFGGYSDGAPGFLVVIDTGTKHLLSAFAGAPSGTASGSPFGGMWAEGGPALDSGGRIYVTTGNTPSGSGTTTGYWGQSLLVFNSTLPLSLAGTYTPWNYPAMDVNDTDLCGSGVNVLPDLPGMNAHIAAFGGKQGNAYLVDRDNLPGLLTNRPPTNLTSDQDQSLIPPTLEPYYNNNVGPLNVFGPYSENSNDTNFAKSRTTPAYFQTADGTNYLIHAGATKKAVGSTTSVPPCVARLLINSSATAPSYLSIDATENTLTFLSPGSPLITSNGSSSFVSWNLDANVARTGGLDGTKPFLAAVDPISMTKLFKSAGGTLHPGGKYNEVCPARGMVFVGTDRIQAFGLTANIVSINAGGAAAGNFVDDVDFTGGDVLTDTDSITSSRITHPAPTAVYQSLRTGVAGAGFTYAIPGLKPNHAYDVRLHFCDPVSTAAGQRQFNVAINGTTVLSNYDVFTAAGGTDHAIAEPFNAIADSTGTITINFTSGAASDPIVNGIEVRAPTLKWEAEDLTVQQFVGPDIRVFTDGSLSAGAASILDSNAVSNSVTYIVPSVPQATYDIRVGYKGFPSRGIFQLAIGRPNATPTNVGAPQDEYIATSSYAEFDIGNWTPGTTSDKWFWFTVTGKNAASSGYTVTVDYIKLIPQ